MYRFYADRSAEEAEEAEEFAGALDEYREARRKSSHAGLIKTDRQELAAKGGGKARAKALSPEERSRIARQAALEMWRKRRATQPDDE